MAHFCMSHIINYMCFFKYIHPLVENQSLKIKYQIINEIRPICFPKIYIFEPLNLISE